MEDIEFYIKGMKVIFHKTFSGLYEYTFYNSSNEIVFHIKANWNMGRKQLQNYWENGQIRTFKED